VSTALVDNPPFGGYRSGTSLRRADRSDGPGIDTLSARVSAPFFATAEVPLLRGRPPLPAPVPEIVVNETLARNLWSTDDPLGQRVWSGTFDRKQYVVVGVWRDVPYQSLRERTDPFFFGSLEPRNGGRVIVRTRGAAAPIARAAKSGVEAIDSTLQVSAIPVAAGVAHELDQSLEVVQVLGMVGALALLLAAIGIAAVTSQVVVDRTHEIGVRIALGARGRDAVRLLVTKGLRPVAVGLVLGITAAVLGAQGMRSVLYGLSPVDPTAFGGATLVLIAASALAAYVPARRASRVDPIIALRAE